MTKQNHIDDYPRANQNASVLCHRTILFKKKYHHKIQYKGNDQCMKKHNNTSLHVYMMESYYNPSFASLTLPPVLF